MLLVKCFFIERITTLNPWRHQSCVCVCLSSIPFALGGLVALPCAPTVSCSLQLHSAESGSLTCLIAFDSSLSSLVDQWSSLLFIRNINVPHIPTGSATTHEPGQSRGLFCYSLKISLDFWVTLYFFQLRNIVGIWWKMNTLFVWYLSLLVTLHVNKTLLFIWVYIT